MALVSLWEWPANVTELLCTYLASSIAAVSFHDIHRHGRFEKKSNPFEYSFVLLYSGPTVECDRLDDVTQSIRLLIHATSPV